MGLTVREIKSHKKIILSEAVSSRRFSSQMAMHLMKPEWALMSEMQVMDSRSQIFRLLLEEEYIWLPQVYKAHTAPLWACGMFITLFHL